MKLTSVALASAIAVAGSVAQAATYSAESYSMAPGGHSLWLGAGIGPLGTDFHFVPAGTFATNGTVGTLQGRVESSTDSTSGFDVDITFDSNFGFTPEYKKEGGAKEADVFDLAYLNLAFGTLTGFGQLADLTLDVTRRPANGPYATQYGTGANAKNGSDFGLASWIYVSADTSSTCTFCDTTFLSGYQKKIGDFNLKLNGGDTPGPVVPLPAGGVLLLTALAGAGLVKTRKS